MGEIRPNSRALVFSKLGRVRLREILVHSFVIKLGLSICSSPVHGQQIKTIFRKNFSFYRFNTKNLT